MRSFFTLIFKYLPTFLFYPSQEFFSFIFYHITAKKGVTNNMNCFQVSEPKRTDQHRIYFEKDWEG